ncbi:maleylpyruvate isomerase family mycothiol-dependent enzyme [Kitasatospora sp. McL0602]|uniref:maleylpyruvate isomerase family mycothiol-dependent enzyme n=1 Tax=Kitasatospora sp. McL0602 TaxID=3439530 RepID=UPI003F8A5848
MEIIEHIDALRREGALLADAIAATDPDAPVPTCPDWRLRDLVQHTGQVHRWATSYVAEGHRQPVAPDSRPPADADLLDWFREGHDGLVAALAGAPAELDCWTFLAAPSPLAFWARRQAHETAVHRVDAEAAAGRPARAVPAAFGRDGIEELVTGLLARPKSRLRSEQERTLLIRPTDADAPLLVRIGPDPLQVSADADSAADCTLSGSAGELYLLLWNRLPLSAVEVTGDQGVLDLWRESAQIRWS